MPLDVDRALSELIATGKILPEDEIRQLCSSLKDVLIRESNVHQIQAPVTVVGDVHGQFYDVLEIFRIGGWCPDTNYLFLGDFVDRGYHSVETITLLCLLKLRWPSRISLLRGNHETRTVTQVYGFYNECMRKYKSAKVWRMFTDLFDYLTLAAVIDNTVFSIHGGLSPSISSIDQIKVLDRFREIPHEGPLADLMWSDPESARDEFRLSPRGTGYTFGAAAVKHFNALNGIDHILRAHQLCMEGYQVFFENQLSTVWSAPNYCYRCGNLASILEVSPGGKQRHFNIFSAAPESSREAQDSNPAEKKVSEKLDGTEEGKETAPNTTQQMYFL